MTIQVLVHNEPAIAFWRALGFNHAIAMIAKT
jgi:hypothetical protein